MKHTLMALALVAASVASLSTQAATVNMTSANIGGSTYFYLDNPALKGVGTDATVICPVGACSFLGGDDLPNSSLATEIAFLNTLINPDVTTAGYTKTDFPSGNSHGFDVDSQYFMMKFGDGIDAWFENLWFPGTTDVSVRTGRGAGLSHVTMGPPGEVPLPGTLGLLGLGFAALGMARRRTAAQ